ncbi:DUF4251 domain-containing protein [Chryseolinea sp. T2]|uniref:DUF4251 domain-containing protein n=1 Tax=Chryseolinea sp. T2 TaxID=3129255 RepID=UPI003078354B
MKLTLIAMLFIIIVGTDLQAQDSVDQSVKDKRFTINVESMSPRRGGFRRLTTLYTFTVTPDTVVTDLPYAGRAYQAPMGTDDAGIKFLSRDFEYQSKPGKKGAWEIQLKLKDTRNYPVINITLQPSGSASIRITPVDKDYISYMGTVVMKK